MAENRRVRIEDDIENYLQSHAERVLGKSAEVLSTADYSTLTNRLLYEHKLAQGFVQQVPFGGMWQWLIDLLPSLTHRQISSVSTIPQPTPPPKSPPVSRPVLKEDYSFDASFSEMFEDEAA